MYCVCIYILNTYMYIYLYTYLSIYLYAHIYTYILYIYIYIIYYVICYILYHILYIYIHIYMYNLYIWLTISSYYGWIPLVSGLMRREGGLSTLCHSCGFACQQRVLKTFPGPGYLHSEDGVVWLWHSLVNLYIYIYIYGNHKTLISIMVSHTTRLKRDKRNKPYFA